MPQDTVAGYEECNGGANLPLEITGTDSRWAEPGDACYIKEGGGR